MLVYQRVIHVVGDLILFCGLPIFLLISWWKLKIGRWEVHGGTQLTVARFFAVSKSQYLVNLAIFCCLHHGETSRNLVLKKNPPFQWTLASRQWLQPVCRRWRCWESWWAGDRSWRGARDRSCRCCSHLTETLLLVGGDWNHGILWFSIYWEYHHPNWRSHIFQRGCFTTIYLQIWGLCFWEYPPNNMIYWSYLHDI